MIPPRHLSAAARKWWKAIDEEYYLEPQKVKMLTLAAEALDRCEQARQILAADGVIVEDRYGAPKAHPAVAIERDSRLAFARLVRELALADDEGPGEARPPRLPRGR